MFIPLKMVLIAIDPYPYLAEHGEAAGGAATTAPPTMVKPARQNGKLLGGEWLAGRPNNGDLLHSHGKSLINGALYGKIIYFYGPFSTNPWIDPLVNEHRPW